jgi:putative ABC transport system ATP-binding protein
LIVADEPTGNLDSQTAAQVMELFKQLTVDGKTVLVVTHDSETSVEPDRFITIIDGRIV